MDKKVVSRPMIALFLVITIMVCTLGSSEFSPKFIGPERIYVDADATGANNGTSWANAFTHLQDAFDKTESESFYPYEIWVAEGVYYPDEDSIGSNHTNNSQSESFTFNYNYVELYGGFSGIESSIDERDWVSNLTILSGDIDQNDANLDGNHIAEDWMDISGNNSYHIVMLDGTTYGDITSGTVIDGFVITAGDASSITHYGGGIFCFADGATADCHPELRNLTVQGNRSFIGGGIMLYANFGGKSSPQMTNISFIGNRAEDNGGGMYVFVANDQGSEGSPVMVNVRFHNNSSGDDGGGFGLTAHQGTGSPTFTNVEFCSNVAADDGGGLSIMASTSGTVLSDLINLSFFGNQAEFGGGIKTHQTAGSTFEMAIINTVVWGNVATNARPEIYNYGSSPIISHSDFKDCGGSGPGWDSTFCGTDGGNNIDEDPLFVSGYDCDLRLKAGSPAVDSGDQSAMPADVTDLDQDGNFAETLPDDIAFNPRVEGNEVDMGVYEGEVKMHSPVADFNGDGDTDFSYYRPSNGYWYYSDDGSPSWTWFGGESTDIIVPGDYNGDGDTDFAYYRPSNGYWYVYDDGTPSYTWWGAAPTDILVPGDYNGDGDTDFAYYRPSTGFWYVKDDGVGSWEWWGAAPTDILVPGDYNGDGDTDLAYYRPSNGFWYVKDDGVPSWEWWGAAPTDVLVPGDFNGDGDTDLAYYRPSNGFWYVKDDGSPSWEWWGAAPTDVLVPGDYNGDGDTDLAYYRPSNGFWYVKDDGTPSWIWFGALPDDIIIPGDINGDGVPW